MKETNSPQPPPGTPGPFNLSNENILKNTFVKSGFTDITIEIINLIFDFDSAEDYSSFVHGTAAPVRAMLVNETPKRREEILKAIAESSGRYADNNTGIVKLSDEALCMPEENEYKMESSLQLD